MNQPEDVEVVLGHKRHYKFHSGTLARSSTLFADMLTEASAAKLKNRARNEGVKIRWMIEMVRAPSEQQPTGLLDLVPLTPLGERADNSTGLIVNENGRLQVAEKTFDHYESILYAFYNKEIPINDTDMMEALKDCYRLLQIADYLGCTNLVSKAIEVALLKHGQELFRSIQVSPHTWIEVAHQIRSEVVFRECIIHLVGNWKTFKTSQTVSDRLRAIPGLRVLIEKYYRTLSNHCKALELSVMSQYPGSMCLPVEDLPIKREAYSKDILIWMALTFFRHWVGQRLIMEKGRQAMDCGFQLYTQIGAGGEAYMDKSVINQFHTKFPMTKKAMNVLENHLFEIKEWMQGVVDQSGILKSNSQLDVHRFPVGYLTCTEFQRDDYPWLGEKDSQRMLPVKRTYKPGGNDIARQNLASTRMLQDRSLSVADVNGDVEGDLLEDIDEDMEQDGLANKRIKVD